MNGGGAVFINVEAAAQIIWAMKRSELYNRLATDEHQIIIDGEPIDFGAEQDDDTAEFDLISTTEEAQDGR